MNQENIMVKCDRCGTKNRIPASRTHESPICGKCKSPLKAGAFPKQEIERHLTSVL